jgi:hypothetical protein
VDHGPGTLAVPQGWVLTMARMSSRRPSAAFSSSSSPLALADIALDGIEAGAAEILADDWSRSIKRFLAEDPAVVYPRLAAALSAIAD